MPQYMVMIMEDEAEDRKLAPSETKALVEGHAAYEQKLRATGAYLDGGRLRPSAEGRRVSGRDGQALVEAERLEAAVALAEECPLSPGGALDVRPLMKGRLRPDKTSQQGRVFGYAVLGNAPNEQAWIDVMDRIDTSTREGFPADRSLGGVRLEAPGRGCRLTAVGGHRAVFDGPFLESKEVIGGLFFMQMASVEEAVDWVTRTEFIKYGAVEIRELWRS